jgi:trimeric autotransporter adhesin
MKMNLTHVFSLLVLLWLPSSWAAANVPEGVAQPFAEVLAPAVPCNPPTITGQTITQTTITLTWNAEATAFGGYSIQWSAPPSLATNIISVPSTQRSVTLPGLTPGTAYRILVRSLCDATTQSTAVERNLTTLGSASTTCLAPSFTNIVPGSNFINLEWTAATSAASYELGIRVSGSGTAFTTITKTTTNHSFTGLMPNGRYDIQIRSQCGPTLFSPLVPLSVSTFATSDCPATSIAGLTPEGPNSILVVWNVASGTPFGYRLEFRPAGSTALTAVDVPATSNNTRLTGLMANTTYEVRVTTRCSATLNAEPSLFQSATTACLPPVITSITPNADQLLINWQPAPVSVTGYRIEYKRLADATFTTVDVGNVGTHTITGLMQNTAYEVRLLSNCSSTFRSLPSAAVTVTTLSNICPNTDWITVVPTENTIRATWRAILGDILGYRIEYKRAIDATYIGLDLPTGSVEHIITGLLPNTLYDIRVRVRCTATSNSTFITRQVTTVALGGGCAAPTNLRLVPDLTSLTLAFTPPIATSLIGYRVEYRFSGTGSAFIGIDIPASLSFYRITGLAAASSYEVRLRTRCSSTNNSDWVTVIGSTSTMISCAPPVLTGVSASLTSISLTWIAEPGATVTGYTVEWRTGADPFSSVVLPSTQLSYSINGLVAGATYEVRLRASCPTAASDPITRTVSLTPVISCFAPTILTATGADTRIIITWEGSLSASNGYTLSYRPVSAPNWLSVNVPASVTRFEIPGLMIATEYDVRLRSVCNLGTVSDWVSRVVRTSAAACNPPATSIHSTTNNSISLEWPAEPTATQGYTIRYRAGADAFQTMNVAAGLRTASLTGLMPGTTYEIEVISNCAAGALSVPWRLTGRTSNPACNTSSFTTVVPTADGITVNWGAVDFATDYVLTWRPTGGAVSQVQLNSSTTTHIITGLSACTSYDLTLNAVCGSGNSSALTRRTISTTAPATQPTTVQINAGVITLRSCGPADLSADSPRDGASYQWRMNGMPIAGGTRSTYVATATGQYDLLVSFTPNCPPVASNRMNVIVQPVPAVTAFVQQQASSPTTNDGILVANCVDVADRPCAANSFGYRYRVTRTGFDSGYISSNVISGLASGSYTVFIQDQENNCVASYTDAINTTISAVVCNAPASVTVRAAGDQVIATWPASASASNGYLVLWNVNGGPFTESTVVANSFSIIGAIPNATYTVAVRSRCGTVNSNLVSGSVVTTSSSVCLSPSITGIAADANTALISWTEQPGATNGYLVQLRDVLTNAVNEQTAPAGTASLAVSGLMANTSYAVQVSSRCSGGNSQPSELRNFSTSGESCPAPFITSLSATSTSATMFWTSISGARAYGIRYRPVGTPTWTDLNIPALSNFAVNSRVLFALIPNTSYEVQVNTTCRTTTSLWSPSANFFTGFNRTAADAQQAFGNELNVYPNPTQGDFALSFNAEKASTWTISIHDALGRLVFNTATELRAGNQLVPVHLDAPSGLYFVTLTDGQFQAVRRLMVE